MACALRSVVQQLFAVVVDAVVLAGDGWAVGDNPANHAPEAKGHAEVGDDLKVGTIIVTRCQIAHVALVHVAAEVLFDPLPPRGSNEGKEGRRRTGRAKRAGRGEHHRRR